MEYISLTKVGLSEGFHGLQEKMTLMFYSLGDAVKKLNCQSRYIIDSFPVSVCHNIRIKNSKILKNKKLYRGKCVSKREYFFGFKVQLIVSENGIPVDFYLLAGSLADITALKAMHLNLPEQSELYGDAAYTDYQLEDMYKDHELLELLIARRLNSKRMNRSMWNILKNKCESELKLHFRKSRH